MKSTQMQRTSRCVQHKIDLNDYSLLSISLQYYYTFLHCPISNICFTVYLNKTMAYILHVLSTNGNRKHIQLTFSSRYLTLASIYYARNILECNLFVLWYQMQNCMPSFLPTARPHPKPTKYTYRLTAILWKYIGRSLCKTFEIKQIIIFIYCV